MKVRHTLISFLVACSSTAFADVDIMTTQELCAQAQAQHAGKDVPGADLSVAMAKSRAGEEGVALPDWCQKHYRELRLSGLAYDLQQFDAGYGDDWNFAWNQIPWIEHTAREMGVTLSPTYYAKAIVVKARNEEIRRYFISLCKTEDKCILRD